MLKLSNVILDQLYSYATSYDISRCILLRGRVQFWGEGLRSSKILLGTKKRPSIGKIGRNMANNGKIRIEPGVWLLATAQERDDPPPHLLCAQVRFHNENSARLSSFIYYEKSFSRCVGYFKIKRSIKKVLQQ